MAASATATPTPTPMPMPSELVPDEVLVNDAVGVAAVDVAEDAEDVGDEVGEEVKFQTGAVKSWAG
jgi:hypothetical protein